MYTGFPQAWHAGASIGTKPLPIVVLVFVSFGSRELSALDGGSKGRVVVVNTFGGEIFSKRISKRKGPLLSKRTLLNEEKTRPPPPPPPRRERERERVCVCDKKERLVFFSLSLSQIGETTGRPDDEVELERVSTYIKTSGEMFDTK